MASRHDQINRAVSAGGRLCLSTQPFTKDIIIKICLFFWYRRSKFQNLIFYFLKIIDPLQAMIIVRSKFKKTPGLRFPSGNKRFSLHTVHSIPQDTADVNHRIYGFFRHICCKDQLLLIFDKRPIFCHKRQFILISRK